MFPPIVDEKIFKQCNDIMDSHKHRQRKEIDDEDIYFKWQTLLWTAETGKRQKNMFYNLKLLKV